MRGLDLIAFIALGIIWGSNFLFMRDAVQVIAPLQVAWLRVCFGALPILGFAVARGAVRRRDIRYAKHFAAMSILATVLPYVFFVKGAQLLHSGAAGAVSGVIPLMTAAFATVFLRDEKLTRARALGILSGLVGVAIVADVRRLYGTASDNAALLGTLAMLAGSAGYASALVYARRFITPLQLSPVALAAYQTVGAGVLLSIAAPARGVEALIEAPRALVALTLGLGLVGTGIGFILYYRIIERLGAIAASSVFYLPPVVALLLGALVAHEAIGPWQWFGTALILGGVFLSRQGAPREAKQGDPASATDRPPSDPMRVHKFEDGVPARGPNV